MCRHCFPMFSRISQQQIWTRRNLFICTSCMSTRAQKISWKRVLTTALRNYAKSHPDLCILAVNTFVQDSEDPNPLVRALAVRTMGCIRVDKMVDYMEEPLRKTLRDESPYVRKTAAICVAKLFDLNPTMCIENGFLATLQEMIGDPNPMVVANSVTALVEINEAAPETQALKVTP